MATKIVTKNSSTASAVPTASDLVQGELAVNVADKKLFTEDNSGAIIELADGVKLAGIEAGADVTDTANVTAAGALMDSELTSIASVKALDQGVATTDSPTFNDGTFTGILNITPTSGYGHIEVGGVDGAFIDLKSPSSDDYDLRMITTGGTGGTIDVGSTGDLSFNAGGSERARLLSTGEVGIGTASPSTKLEVNGQGCFQKNYSFASTNYHIKLKSAYGNGISSYIGNVSSSDRMNISAGGYYYGSSLYQLTDGATGMGAINIGEDGTLTYQNTTGATANSTVNPAERLRIDSAGQVGIGTASPSTYGGKLNITDGAVGGESTLVISNNNANQFVRVGINNNTAQIAYDNADSLAFGEATDSTTAGLTTERMRIDSSGNLLVGVPTTSVTSGGFAFLTGSVDYQLIGHASGVGSGNYYIGFGYNGSIIGSIAQSGTTGIAYNTSSDYRLKTDVQPMTGATDRLKALKPVNFEWIADGTRVDGFLAHEAQEVVPECVTGEKDAMMEEEYEVTPAVLDEEGNTVEEAVMGTRSLPDYQGIDQSKLVPLLVATIQELEARITQLENN